MNWQKLILYFFCMMYAPFAIAGFCKIEPMVDYIPSNLSKKGVVLQSDVYPNNNLAPLEIKNNFKIDSRDLSLDDCFKKALKIAQLYPFSYNEINVTSQARNASGAVGFQVVAIVYVDWFYNNSFGRVNRYTDSDNPVFGEQRLDPLGRKIQVQYNLANKEMFKLIFQ